MHVLLLVEEIAATYVTYVDTTPCTIQLLVIVIVIVLLIVYMLGAASNISLAINSNHGMLLYIGATVPQLNRLKLLTTNSSTI